MRRLIAAVSALALVGCVSPITVGDQVPAYTTSYRVDAWARDTRKMPIGRTLQGLTLVNFPTVAEQRSLLVKAGKSEVQIYAFCDVLGESLDDCRDIRVAPNNITMKGAARKFIEQRRIAHPQLASTVPRPNYAAVEMRVAERGASLGASGDCILLRECGIPTPPAPVPPPTKSCPDGTRVLASDRCPPS